MWIYKISQFKNIYAVDILNFLFYNMSIIHSNTKAYLKRCSVEHKIGYVVCNSEKENK